MGSRTLTSTGPLHGDHANPVTMLREVVRSRTAVDDESGRVWLIRHELLRCTGARSPILTELLARTQQRDPGRPHWSSYVQEWVDHHSARVDPTQDLQARIEVGWLEMPTTLQRECTHEYSLGIALRRLDIQIGSGFPAQQHVRRQLRCEQWSLGSRPRPREMLAGTRLLPRRVALDKAVEPSTPRLCPSASPSAAGERPARPSRAVVQ